MSFMSVFIFSSILSPSLVVLLVLCQYGCLVDVLSVFSCITTGMMTLMPFMPIMSILPFHSRMSNIIVCIVFCYSSLMAIPLLCISLCISCKCASSCATVCMSFIVMHVGIISVALLMESLSMFILAISLYFQCDSV